MDTPKQKLPIKSIKSIKSQLVVTFDGEKFQAEIPKGGGRRVVDLPKNQSQWGQVLEPELIELRFWLKTQEEEKQNQEQIAKKVLSEAKIRFDKSRHFRVWDTTAGNHGQHFANQTVGKRDARGVDPRLKDLKKLLVNDPL